MGIKPKDINILSTFLEKGDVLSSSERFDSSTL